MRVIVERFEGDSALLELEDGTIISVPKKLVVECQEGDVIDILKNEKETENRKQKVETLINKLFQ